MGFIDAFIYFYLIYVEVLGNSRLKKKQSLGRKKGSMILAARMIGKGWKDVEEKALVDILYFRHSYVIASRKIS